MIAGGRNELTPLRATEDHAWTIPAMKRRHLSTHEVVSGDVNLSTNRSDSYGRRRVAARRCPGSARLLAVLAVAITGCGTDSKSLTTTAVPATSPPAVSTSHPIQPPPSSLPVTTQSPLTTTPTTLDDELIETREIGRSVEDRPITGERRGTPGGRVVLIVGVIHGDERDALSIMDRLHRLEVPAGVDLWLVDSMNPDGYAADTRQNANKVDLNRNFPYQWAPIGAPGDWQYSGPFAASEPETQAMTAFMLDTKPELTIWYHQDYFRIAPSTGPDAKLRERYAELTGLPLLPIAVGTYTGTATTWERNALDRGMAFVVELGPTLTDAEADVHADAVLTVVRELD